MGEKKEVTVTWSNIHIIMVGFNKKTMCIIVIWIFKSQNPLPRSWLFQFTKIDNERGTNAYWEILPRKNKSPFVILKSTFQKQRLFLLRWKTLSSTVETTPKRFSLSLFTWAIHFLYQTGKIVRRDTTR